MGNLKGKIPDCEGVPSIFTQLNFDGVNLQVFKHSYFNPVGIPKTPNNTIESTVADTVVRLAKLEYL